MTSCLNVWELITISKGWGRQGRKPKTHTKAPVSITEPGLLPLKPGLWWGYTSGTPTPAAPSLPCSAPGVHGEDTNRTQKLSTSAHSWISNAQMEGRIQSHSTWCSLSLLSLSWSLFVDAIIALFLTILLPRESLHSSRPYLACARIF